MTNSPVKNLPRYLKHFIGTPYLVFVPVHGHSECGDSSQPFTRANPKPVGQMKSIATYPLDNEMVIFGFALWADAARAALDNGTEVFESDPAVALAEKRAYDIAYVIWDVRTNAAYDRRNGKPERTIEGEFIRKGLHPVTSKELSAAIQWANRSGSSTPC
jgi:hypothetical protein